jgi:glycosyltransferase involved in cell wall biosynthesis
MKFLDDVTLVIIGSGDVIHVLKEMAEQNHLEEKILFIGKLPPDELRSWTRLADIGLTLDKDTNINYRFSLPNKIFDYIHAGIPVLASNLVEVKKIVETYNVGKITPNHDPASIAKIIREMLASPEYPVWKENTKKAALELNWENERRNLVAIFEKFL